MSKHYVIRMVDGWMQEVTATEGLAMIKRAVGGGGVMFRSLKNGGMVVSQHIVGIQVVNEDLHDRMRREKVDYNALDVPDALPSVTPPDETRAFVDEISDTADTTDTVAMSNDEFRKIYEGSGLSQQAFSDKIGYSLTTVRMALKNDKQVSEALAEKVSQTFPAEG